MRQACILPYDLNFVGNMSRRVWIEFVMHLSTGCPTIPLLGETKGYQGDFTGEAGPRVGHLTFPYTLT